MGPLRTPDARDPDGLAHLRKVDDAYFGRAPDPTAGASPSFGVGVTCPVIPAGMARTARAGSSRSSKTKVFPRVGIGIGEHMIVT